MYHVYGLGDCGALVPPQPKPTKIQKTELVEKAPKMFAVFSSMDFDVFGAMVVAEAELEGMRSLALCKSPPIRFSHEVQSEHITQMIARAGHWKELCKWVGLMRLRKVGRVTVDVPELKCPVCRKLGTDALEQLGLGDVMQPHVADGDGADSAVKHELAVAVTDEHDELKDKAAEVAEVPLPPLVPKEGFVNLKVRSFVCKSALTFVYLQIDGRVHCAFCLHCVY